MDEKQYWMSAHIYHYGSLDNLISDGLKSFFKEIEKKDGMQKYFFIRYWIGGPHIRVRIYGNDLFLKEAKDLLQHKVNLYAEKYDENIVFNKELYKTYSNRIKKIERYEGQVEKLYPADSIQYIPYEPEWSRYGGEYGVQIAEEWFYNSSKLILDVLPSVKDNVGKRFLMALKCFTVFLKYTSMDLKEKILFCQSYYNYWSKYALEDVMRDFKQKAMKDFKQQEDIFSHIVQSSLMDMEKNDEWLGRYALCVKKTVESLDSAIDAGKIILGNDEENRHTNYYTILSSYIHMHNNRLGIGPHIEAVCALYISLILEKIHNGKEEVEIYE
ncbi:MULTISPECIES: thiopeptide-type bacteriocin biosynthesis protein [unclassified Bacillus (in: firmicutes)]|uniref:thiopeptide-type bacteriocin biosynthesis protein n=1 Tax=unclassified Bacillus (in: firmicutes) TaxID=185979 RepID=UPI0011460C8C|nr:MULTISPECIES: thiopeptide-type bacteriocin biosynthesis protein [unclassified Bacillus (in: firmicutes)]